MTFSQELKFWQDLAPWLSIAENARPAPIPFDGDALTAIGERFQKEGYLQLPPQFEKAELAPIRQGMLALREAGLPPVFIYIYDQPWRLFSRLSVLIRQFLGEDFALLPNFWAWDIPPRAGARGWPPHRDCQARTRFSDGLGGNIFMSLSLWIPLVDVAEDQACMHVLPRSRENADGPSLENLEGLNQADGLALPSPAGGVLGWPQDVIHWSGAMSESQDQARLSLSLEFQSRSFEALAAPLLDIQNPPAFHDRLSLIESQFQKYRHMEV